MYAACYFLVIVVKLVTASVAQVCDNSAKDDGNVKERW